MTVKDMKELLECLPDDMDVVLETEGNTFTTACIEQSDTESLPLEDEGSPDGYSFTEVFVIRPCTCHVEDMPVVPDIQENLN